jgi:hypothetical protein
MINMNIKKPNKVKMGFDNSYQGSYGAIECLGNTCVCFQVPRF